MSEERIVEALQALVRSDREKYAPPEVEAALQRAFRRPAWAKRRAPVDLLPCGSRDQRWWRLSVKISRLGTAS